VLQAFEYVRSGDAEAGLVSGSVVKGDSVRLLPIDDQLHDTIVQALGVVEGSPRRAEAEAFARFVLGEAGRGVLERSGFHLPGKP
jgi:molybdate transport system substrate-binding protein